MTTWAQAFPLITGILGLLAAVYATRVGQRGKDKDLAQKALTDGEAAELAERKQRFDELNASLNAARLDLAYYERQLAAARENEKIAVVEKERLQQEWLARHSRLLERCHALATQLQAILNGPLTLPEPQEQRIKQAIGDVERHIREDHETIGSTAVTQIQNEDDQPPSQRGNRD